MSVNAGLAGQTVLVIGGTSGIGLETARSARAEGADVIITGRDPDRLQRVGLELDAGIAAFDATDAARLERFFRELPGPVDHVMVSGSEPSDAPLDEPDFDEAGRSVVGRAWQLLQVARNAAEAIRPGGTLLFVGDTARRRPGVGPVITTLTVGVVGPADIAALAVRLMTNAAVTGASFDLDRGQQLVEG